MTVNEMKTALNELEKEMYAYRHAMSSIELDSETAAPKDSDEGRGTALEVLSAKSYELFVNDEVRKLLDGMWAAKDELNEVEARRVELLRERLDKNTRIPVKEYAEFAGITNAAGAAWRKAKESNDFASFCPHLEKVVEYQRRFAGYMAPDKKPYDALLDDYEKGMSMEMLDGFFTMLRNELVPALKAIGKLPPSEAFTSAACSVQKQRELSQYVMDIMGLPSEYSAIAESEHPFTLAFNSRDVRITTHYYENAVLSSLYSVIHESGHALYELHMPAEHTYTCLSDCASMSYHESQSRLFENMVGRNRGFISCLAPKLRELFPEAFANVEDEAIYRAANRIEPSLVRTEADEVTYPLHIMVRYELEKKLIAGELAVKELPEAWNALYKDYLGITPPNDTLGVLQDVHWSGGMIGYFPTYALGSAYAAQFMHAMRKQLDVDGLLSRGELAPIEGWLSENVQRHGSLYDPDRLMLLATGEGFNPKYYVEHLCGKAAEAGKW